MGKFDEELSKTTNLWIRRIGNYLKSRDDLKENLKKENKSLDECFRYILNEIANEYRKDNDIEKPFVTVEMKNGTVIQARGYKNNIENPLEENVKNFINAWCNKFHLKSCF